MHGCHIAHKHWACNLLKRVPRVPQGCHAPPRGRGDERFKIQDSGFRIQVSGLFLDKPSDFVDYAKIISKTVRFKVYGFRVIVIVIVPVPVIVGKFSSLYYS